MVQEYKLLKDAQTNEEAKAGTTVYQCAYYDYGLASDDTVMTGIPHVSVTLNSDGSYPFFTVPKADIEVV